MVIKLNFVQTLSTRFGQDFEVEVQAMFDVYKYSCICAFVVLYSRCHDVIVCSSGGCACQAPVSRDFGSISQLHFLQCEIQILRAEVFGTGTCHATAHNVLFQMTNHHKDILGWLTLVWKRDPLSPARYQMRSNTNLSCFEL